MAFNAYMHKRNIYRNQPDFTQIALDFPEFRKYAIPDAKGQKVRVDFTNTDALRMLTKILLKKDFNLNVDIPEGFLIPTVPQRLNYILWLEDLLSNISKRQECISGIDIGTGPCAIFSLLGAQKNGWKFIATENSNDAILWAEKNIAKNNLVDSIRVFKVSEGATLNDVLSASDESFDFCMCNPPFFESIEEIRSKHQNTNETIADVAQKEEIFVKGGELDFVMNILKDSLIYKDRISLFTSMFGKKKSMLEIIKEIQEIKDAKFTTTEFCQGNTVRWGIAWTFDKSIQFEEEVKKKRKPMKTKPALEYQIPLKKSENVTLDAVVKQVAHFLKILQIPVIEKRMSTHFAELLLKSDKNTWSHQRRKRRELERQKKETDNLENKQCLLSSSEMNPISCKGNKAEENIHTCTKRESVVKDCSITNQVIKSENNQCLPSENNEPEFPTDVSGIQNNKKKGDSISEICVNKKARLDEKVEKCDSNQSLNAPSDSINLDLKDDCNMENISIKLDLNTSETVYLSKDEVCGQNPSTAESVCSTSKDHSELSSIKRKSEPSSTDENHESSSVPIKSEQSLILDCHLHFIKGKNKIYVKMNCPPTADRNTMHQVFQLIKNKIN